MRCLLMIYSALCMVYRARLCGVLTKGLLGSMYRILTLADMMSVVLVTRRKDVDLKGPAIQRKDKILCASLTFTVARVILGNCSQGPVPPPAIHRPNKA